MNTESTLDLENNDREVNLEEIQVALMAFTNLAFLGGSGVEKKPQFHNRQPHISEQGWKSEKPFGEVK
jgi:hypothetical protein